MTVQPRHRRFSQVDVFTAEPLMGNPVAVVLDGADLSDGQMQRLAGWTNLSETTFLGAPADPTADYCVRIFTPSQELPFAGHPTLGSAHAWLAAGGTPKGDQVVQECAAGLIRIRRDETSGGLAFAAPPRLRSGPLPDADVESICRGLGIATDEVVAHQWCDNGPPWQAVLLPSAERVLSLAPDPVILAGRFVGVVGPWPPRAAGDPSFEVRAFFAKGSGLAEDPVTGSLNAALGQWLIGSGRAGLRYVAAQGAVLGRAGRVEVHSVDGEVWVGGQCMTVIRGSLLI